MNRSIRIFIAVLPLPMLSAVLGADATPSQAKPDRAAAAEATSLHAAASDRVSARPELVIAALGFGSCARQERPQPIWDAINAARCHAFSLCGDNIYADTSDPAVFREKYALLAAMPGFAKLRQHPPLFATWDGLNPSLRLEVCGLEGNVVLSREISFSEIQSK